MPFLHLKKNNNLDILWMKQYLHEIHRESCLLCTLSSYAYKQTNKNIGTFMTRSLKQ